MSEDIQLVHACDYCGRFTSVDATSVSYEPLRWLDDACVLVRAGTYCGSYCARRSGQATVPVSGR